MDTVQNCRNSILNLFLDNIYKTTKKTNLKVKRLLTNETNKYEVINTKKRKIDNFSNTNQNVAKNNFYSRNLMLCQHCHGFLSIGELSFGTVYNNTSMLCTNCIDLIKSN